MLLMNSSNNAASEYIQLTTNNAIVIDGSISVTLSGVGTHFLCISMFTGGADVYVDGALAATTHSTLFNWDLTAGVSVGSTWVGVIADIRFYDYFLV